MGKIRILADSTCDLGDELLHNYEIDILPLYIMLGERSGKDGLEIKPDDIYDWAEANHETPKTSAIAITDAIKAIEKYKTTNDDIIFFGISEDMSSTCHVMRMAAEELDYSDHVYVINSKNLSTGIGLLIIHAAELINEGKSLSEIMEVIDQLREKVRASFVIDTLTYLYRGGRCSPMTALIGNTLRLKPKIVVENGKMDVGGKYRGKQSVVVRHYVKDLEEQLRNAEPGRVFITHSGIDDGIVQEVKEYLLGMDYFKEVLVTRAGGVVSSHCGPGTLGVLFIEK